MVYMPPQNNFARRSGSVAKSKPLLPSDGVMQKYKDFGLLFEIDVSKTCEDTLKKEADNETIKMLKFEST